MQRKIILLMAMMVLAGSVWGRDWAPALVSAQVGFHSRELWRGLRMTDGPVAVASASAWEGGFLLSGWLSVELDEGHVREADLTVERRGPAAGAAGAPWGM